jgi:RNA polymerase sigma factor (sigma-70 family)
MLMMPHQISLTWKVEYQEIKSKAEAVISAMPPKRQEIFRLSREQGLKNKEIAEKLQISIKTVENPNESGAKVFAGRN